MGFYRWQVRQRFTGLRIYLLHAIVHRRNQDMDNNRHPDGVQGVIFIQFIKEAGRGQLIQGKVQGMSTGSDLIEHILALRTNPIKLDIRARVCKQTMISIQIIVGSDEIVFRIRSGNENDAVPPVEWHRSSWGGISWRRSRGSWRWRASSYGDLIPANKGCTGTRLERE